MGKYYKYICSIIYAIIILYIEILFGASNTTIYKTVIVIAIITVSFSVFEIISNLCNKMNYEQ